MSLNNRTFTFERRFRTKLTHPGIHVTNYRSVVNPINILHHLPSAAGDWRLSCPILLDRRLGGLGLSPNA
jgi:hypothetical protein